MLSYELCCNVFLYCYAVMLYATKTENSVHIYYSSTKTKLRLYSNSTSKIVFVSERNWYMWCVVWWWVFAGWSNEEKSVLCKYCGRAGSNPPIDPLIKQDRSLMSVVKHT